MAQLKIIRPEGAITPEVFNRHQQNVQTALDGIENPSQATQATINKNYSVLATDEVVFADSTRGPLTVSLPATGIRTVTVKAISSSTNAVTVQSANSSQIDGTQSQISLAPTTVKAFRYDTLNKLWRTL